MSYNNLQLTIRVIVLFILLILIGALFSMTFHSIAYLQNYLPIWLIGILHLPVSLVNLFLIYIFFIKLTNITK
jgi:hypothetical protein